MTATPTAKHEKCLLVMLTAYDDGEHERQYKKAELLLWLAETESVYDKGARR
jgi:hypothetical protein